MVPTDLLADGAGRYVHWGVVSISVTNLLIVALMLVVFVLAILLPFPGSKAEHGPDEQS